MLPRAPPLRARGARLPATHGCVVACVWATAAPAVSATRRARCAATLTHPRLACLCSISVTFVDRDGERIVCRAPIGQNLLEVAHASNVDLEARPAPRVSQPRAFPRLTRRGAQGACEGSLACSTCHVIVEDPAYYARLKVRGAAHKRRRHLVACAAQRTR